MRRNSGEVRTLVMLAMCILLVFGIWSCTSNARTRNLGGTMTIELKPGEKLVTATWKDGNDFWYLVRPMHPGETPETWEFREDSSIGVFNGKVVLKEHAAEKK